MSLDRRNRRTAVLSKQPKVIMYTAQINVHGNIIVCRGDTVRNSYRIVFTGTYNECLTFKINR